MDVTQSECMHRSNGQLHGNFPMKAAFPLFWGFQSNLENFQVKSISRRCLDLLRDPFALSGDINEFLMVSNQIERVFKRWCIGTGNE